jgi:hypothetical protein
MSQNELVPPAVKPDPSVESRRLLVFIKEYYREPAFGLYAMKRTMQLATQIWYKELYMRKTDYNVLNWNDDLTKYGMPSLDLVKLAAFLFLLIDDEYDTTHAIRHQISSFLKLSPCYSVIADDVIWIMDQMCIPRAQDRARRDDLLGTALNIVSDADVSKYIGFSGLNRRTKLIYDKYKLDQDDDLDNETMAKVKEDILDYVDKKLLHANLKIYFRTESGLAMAIDLQEKLRQYLNGPYRKYR